MTDIDTLTRHHISCCTAPVHTSEISVVVLAKPVKVFACSHMMRAVQRAVIVTAYLIFGGEYNAVPKIINACMMLAEPYGKFL